MAIRELSISYLKLQEVCSDDLLYLLCFELHQFFEEIRRNIPIYPKNELFDKYNIPDILNNYLIFQKLNQKNTELVNILDKWILDLEELEIKREKELILRLIKKTNIQFLVLNYDENNFNSVKSCHTIIKNKRKQLNSYDKTSEESIRMNLRKRRKLDSIL